MPTTREETMPTDSTIRDRLNTEAVGLMRQEAGTGPKEIELMGKKFIVLPEVFYLSAIQHELEHISHSPLKIVADELARRGPTTPLEVLEIGPGVGHFVIGAASLGPNVHVTAVDISPAAVENVNRNAALHGVTDRVRCAVEDVYTAPVTEGKTFDIIIQGKDLSIKPHEIGTLPWISCRGEACLRPVGGGFPVGDHKDRPYEVYQSSAVRRGRRLSRDPPTQLQNPGARVAAGCVMRSARE